MTFKLFLKRKQKSAIAETLAKYGIKALNFTILYKDNDIVYQTIYESESKSLVSVKSLQKLIGSIDLMANREIANKMTPKELKEFMLDHYKNIYMESVSELEKFVLQLKNIHDNKDKFDYKTYIERYENYKRLIREQESIVQRHKSILEFTTNSITVINKIF